MGTLTQLYAGTMPEAADLGGKVSTLYSRSQIWMLTTPQYLVPWARLGEPLKETQDEKAGAQLWDWLEAQVKNVD